MRPRSVVLDLAGDYIRYHGGVIALGAMSELLAAFDVSEDNVRALMSRLRREGFFQTQRQGRTAEYVLAPDTLHLLDEGRDRIFTRHPDVWDGSWHMVIYQVPETARASRDRLRTGLSWLGFGPLAPSTWLSARDRRPQVRELFTRESDARFDQLTTRSEGAEEDRDLAARCWDLRKLAEEYCAWIAVWRDFDPSALGDEQALVQRTRLVYTYRKFPFADPDLPSALLPVPPRPRRQLRPRRPAVHRLHRRNPARDRPPLTYPSNEASAKPESPGRFTRLPSWRCRTRRQAGSAGALVAQRTS